MSRREKLKKFSEEVERSGPRTENDNCCAYFFLTWNYCDKVKKFFEENSPDENYKFTEEEFMHRSTVEYVRTIFAKREFNARWIGIGERGKGIDDERGCLHFHFSLQLACKTRKSTFVKRIQTFLPTVNVQTSHGANEAKNYVVKMDDTYIAGPWADNEKELEKIMMEKKRKEEEEKWKWEEELDFSEENFYDWQIQLKDRLLNKENRKSGEVWWIIGAKGREGKSDFAYYMQGKYKIEKLTPTKADDLKHIMSKHKMATAVIFDITRKLSKNTSMDDIYNAAEEIQSGYFTSGKYDSTSVFGPKKTIVIFANYPPDLNNLSYGRLKVFGIEKNFEDTITSNRIERRVLVQMNEEETIDYLVRDRGLKDPIVRELFEKKKEVEDTSYMQKLVRKIMKKEKKMRKISDDEDSTDIEC